MVKRVVGVAGERVREVVIGEGEFWARGDNRRCSIDSEDYGAVPVSAIIARCLLVVPLPVVVTSVIERLYKMLTGIT